MGRDPLARVSVVMPVHDAEPYLAEAVESILAQTFVDFEFLIFDDGSEDDSYAILEHYAQADPRIAACRGSHAGFAHWLREGVVRACSPLIARMDADDVAHPRRLERQLDYLAAHPECVAVGCEVWLVDPERRPICTANVPVDHETIEAQLLSGRGTALVHPTLLMRRDAVLGVGNYATDRLGEDVDLFLRLAERGRLANLTTPLLEYRQHPASVNAQCAQTMTEDVSQVLRAAHARRGLAVDEEKLAALPIRQFSPTERQAEWARAAIGGGQRTTARRYAWKVLCAAPGDPRSWALWARALLGVRLEALPAPLRRAAMAVRR